MCNFLSMQNEHAILIGNSFPLSLIRRSIRMEPQPISVLQMALAGKRVVSFWGHANTLHRAEEFAGCGLAPESERPILQLNDDLFPTLGTEVFSKVWILSPDYTGRFRPAVGEEVPPEKIEGWQILKITWETHE